MALEPITRQEQIIAGKDLEPITRMEKFLKQYGGGGGSSGGGSGFDFVITMDATDGSYSLASGSYSDIKEKLLALQPVLGTDQYVMSGSVASSRIMAQVYYAYEEECIYCEEAGVGGNTYKIHPDNTIENV